MQRSQTHNFSRQKGVTLLELMIVVTVIAVLAALVWPAYGNYVVRARRVAATACAMEASQFMERFYTMNLRYDQSREGTAVALPNLECRTQLNDFYTLALGAVDRTSYTVNATPIGVQLAKDTMCGRLSINQRGQKSINGSGPMNKCW